MRLSCSATQDLRVSEGICFDYPELQAIRDGVLCPLRIIVPIFNRRSGLSDPDWNVEFAGYVKRNLGEFGKTLTFHRRVAERNVSSDSAESDSSDAEDGNELGN